MDGYCLRCNEMRTMLNPEPTKTRTNQRAVKGVCPVCGLGMWKIGVRPGD